MRTVKQIDQDIEQCKAQIAATYSPIFLNQEDAIISREGFQKQLQLLEKEKAETQSMLNIEVINPRLVRG